MPLNKGNPTKKDIEELLVCSFPVMQIIVTDILLSDYIVTDILLSD